MDLPCGALEPPRLLRFLNLGKRGKPWLDLPDRPHMSNPPYDYESLRKRLDAARDFPHNTTPASRHAQLIGEALMTGVCHDVRDDPQHAGESILLTVLALYEAKAELAIARAMLGEARLAPQADRAAIRRLTAAAYRATLSERMRRLMR